MVRKLRASQQVEALPPPPPMALKNYDPIVVFEDGSEEVIKVQGVGPVGAIYTAALSARRDWSVEKQLRVIAIKVPV